MVTNKRQVGIATGGANGIEEISRASRGRVNLVVTSRTEAPIKNLQETLGGYGVEVEGFADFVNPGW